MMKRNVQVGCADALKPSEEKVLIAPRNPGGHDKWPGGNPFLQHNQGYVGPGVSAAPPRRAQNDRSVSGQTERPDQSSPVPLAQERKFRPDPDFLTEMNHNFRQYTWGRLYGSSLAPELPVQ
jgi:hypothetical protein